ncbi:hypothetical protein PGIGA_G00222790 [Pangasianodon gigas]|uniref:Uncharacterized protein n=1 Tax=Pangasianodon gigas TaxID=30993 RepID=A0ACC5WJ02_PANGG|nr:hypothetical protein [Pangasianodon gigas]
MSKPQKSHKAMGDQEWMSRLRRFASTGVWPSKAGNRPAPRQKKWYDLFQRGDPITSAAPSGVPTSAPPAPDDGSGSVSSLPPEMRKTIPLQDQWWIASTLYHGGRLRSGLKLWYEPPVPSLIYHQAPLPDRFFTHRLLVWMPYNPWKVLSLFVLFCPVCGKQLTGYGIHKRARRVLDIDRYYLMVTETLRCTACHLNDISTSQTVLNQLDLPHQTLFRVILTYKYACDIRVIRLLRERTLGNSPTRLARQLKENHGEEWLHHLAHYMEECAVFADRPNFLPVAFQEPPEPIEVPTSKCLLTVYGKDIISRLDHIKASITSTFGTILKMDSTKKITKKLAGHAWGTVQWMSSVGNERGQILISVLTAQEGPGLDSMVSGLVSRYQQAGVAPPVLLYVDSGCCVDKGQSKLQTRFGGWPNLNIRLDIWHFMRRLATGCTTDAHPLYPTFMARLSACIFEWDPHDIATKPSSLLTYAGEVVHCINTNSLKVFGRKYIPSFWPPLKYTVLKMSKPQKSHKAMGDQEWMSRLRRFASTGVWPSEAGNRPAPRQKKWEPVISLPPCPVPSLTRPLPRRPDDLHLTYQW